MEFAAESFALLLRLESVGVSAAAAVYERLAHLMLRVVIIRGDGTFAIARLDRCQADRTLRLFAHDRRSYVRDRFRDVGWLLALALAGFSVLEAILVALAAAVLELVARIGATIVIELLHKSVARTDHLGQRAEI